MEVWKQIEECPNHYVSDMGNVKSVDHITFNKGRETHIKGRIFKLSVGGSGYVRVSIEGKSYNVHRLVAKEFLANTYSEHLEVNHKNGIKDDNRVENLEWCTRSYNSIHARKTGLNKGITEEGRKRLSDYHKGTSLSEDTKAKIGAHHAKGYKHSMETKEKIAASITKWHKENGIHNN